MNGPAGGLQGKSIVELKEILERQEKLLSNKKFILKLPDRGRKIMAFTEKVRLAILEHKQLQQKKELLSTFRMEFQTKQSQVEENTQVVLHDDSSSVYKQQDEMDIQADAINSKHSKEDDKLIKGAHKSHLDESDLHTNRSQETINDHTTLRTEGATDICSHADMLVNDLKKISLKDNGEETRDSLHTSAIQERISFLPSGQKKSHYVDIIENRAMNPVGKRDKFMANKLPSGSNSSSPCDSPRESKPKLSVEERRAQDKKHLDDITAAKLPPLRHTPSQLLPLDESLALQIAQKQSYEEQQAKLAAQKLLQKLNIKMVKFNPEGDSYMKYRDLRDKEDSEI
ncbi:protein GRINL1A [Pelodytes ibericus]